MRNTVRVGVEEEQWRTSLCLFILKLLWIRETELGRSSTKPEKAEYSFFVFVFFFEFNAKKKNAT